MTSQEPTQESLDLFDTAWLRQRVLQAWQAAPERFREDANAEEDLRIGGYAGRLAVELAANASDAALAAGAPGTLRVSLVDTERGAQLRVANTGAALDTAGVSALASLRASAKRTGRTVGRFGVGFAAVLAVSDEPSVRSTSGGVRFSRAATERAIDGITELAGELRARQGAVPVLRLPWPESGAVSDGFSTEVVLPLRSEVDGAAVLAGFAEAAGDLLLALPGLRRVEVAMRHWQREELAGGVVAVHGPHGTLRWLLHRVDGEFDAEALRGLGVEERAGGGYWTCWAVPVDARGAVLPVQPDVLHAPTPTDERLSLPARLLATVPVEPTRRRVQRGPACDAVLAAAAASYPGLLAAVAGEQRTKLVPAPGFPLSEVDSKLRDEVLAALAQARWLPSASGSELAPADAVLLADVPAELADLLADVLPGLLTAEVSGSTEARALGAAGVRRIGLSDVVSALATVDREPTWWGRVYAALLPLAEVDPSAREELGGLPVPLADGRTVTGPRSTLLPSADLAALMSTLDSIDVVGLRIVHPDAVHPLLERLGANPADAPDLLRAPELADAVGRSVADAAAGADVLGLADLVLRLVELSDVDSGEHAWLGALALPDADGEFRRADELVAPDAPLLDVLDPDEVGPGGALGLLDAEFAAHRPRTALTGAGVLHGFSVLTDESPAAPEHDLPDERRWWTEIGADVDPPARLAGIRELDLVADDAWPAALRMLAAEPRTWRALAEPDSHPAWWLTRYAVLAGHPPRHWRMPDAHQLAGLYDVLPALDLPERVLATVGVRATLRIADAADAAELLDRLADPDRTVPAGVTLRAHAALADAVSTGVLDSSDVDPPVAVRTLAGRTVAPEEALVADRPWLLDVLDAAETVAAANGAELTGADALAELLDLPLASAEFAGAPSEVGEPVAWADLGAVGLAADLFGVAPPAGTVLLHDELLVAGQPVRWWVDTADAVHAQDSPDGLGRALAWRLDRWADRHLVIAALTDPETHLA